MSKDAIKIYRGPRIFDFQNIHQFLQAYYEFHKRHDPEFSYSEWAKALKFKNRSYLRFVVLGQRLVNSQLCELFLENFGFAPLEEEYFVTLVSLSQSKSQRSKDVFARRLIAISAPVGERQQIEDNFEFLSDPVLPALQTLCGFDDTTSVRTLARKLGIDDEEIEAKLLRLEEMGFLVGRRPRQASWKVPESLRSLGLQAFYKQALNQAAIAISLPSEIRRFRSLFVGLDAKEFANFLKDFEVFVAEQLAKRNVDKIEGRLLYHLNFNFFPVAPDDESSAPSFHEKN